MTPAVIDTETQIKQAAKKIFLKKGLAGTRLQEIADEAGISRTALHYYFRNKEKLFETVWKDIFATTTHITDIFGENNLTMVEKMQMFATRHFDKSCSEPEMDIFLMNEFNNNPDAMMAILLSGKIENPAYLLLNDIEKAVKNGEIEGNPKQILITLLSLCIFATAGKSMLKSMLGLTEEDYEKLMQERLSYLHKFIETAFTPCEVCD
jgi:TetR/AcrR family transcriptional regulator